MAVASERPTMQHVVHFYDDEAGLAATVSAYLAEGVCLGDAALLIATPEHTRSILAAAHLAGSLQEDGSLIALDAAGTLGRFMVDGRPDPDAFDESVGRVVRELSRSGRRRVWAYGEMVGLLWDEGNLVAALEVEQLWNGLLDRVGFSLFCAYPATIIGDGYDDSVREVCRLHTNMVVGSRTVHAQPFTVGRVFPSSPSSVPQARYLIAETLRDRGLDELVAAASVVVTELATNALLHAGGGFEVSMTVGSGLVRLDVRDGSTSVPTIRQSSTAEIAGRGLLVVDAVADRWGTELLVGGKVVWAELGNHPPAIVPPS